MSKNRKDKKNKNLNEKNLSEKNIEKVSGGCGTKPCLPEDPIERRLREEIEHVKNAERRLTIAGTMDSEKDITLQMNFIESNEISKFYSCYFYCL